MKVYKADSDNPNMIDKQPNPIVSGIVMTLKTIWKHMYIWAVWHLYVECLNDVVFDDIGKGFSGILLATFVSVLFWVTVAFIAVIVVGLVILYINYAFVGTCILGGIFLFMLLAYIASKCKRT